jgi:lipopolysaccharide export system protein LptA
MDGFDARRVFDLAGLAASPALAQTLADGLSGFSQQSDDPIEIEADNLEVLDAQNVAIFRGNVEVVTQGTATLQTRELRVHYQAGGDGAIGPTSNQGLRLLEAMGAVEIRSEDQYAAGDQARFDFISEIITLTGNVVLQQGENLVRGQRLVVDLTTRESRLESAPRPPQAVDASPGSSYPVQVNRARSMRGLERSLARIGRTVDGWPNPSAMLVRWGLIRPRDPVERLGHDFDKLVGANASTPAGAPLLRANERDGYRNRPARRGCLAVRAL